MGQTMGNLANPNITGAKPQQAQWGDLDQSEKSARLIGGTTQGLAQGFQNYQQQNGALRQRSGGGGMMQPSQGAQSVDPSYFQPQKTGKNTLNFYGGQ